MQEGMHITFLCSYISGMVCCLTMVFLSFVACGASGIFLLCDGSSESTLFPGSEFEKGPSVFIFAAYYLPVLLSCVFFSGAYGTYAYGLYFALVCSFYDLVSRRIPNYITFSLAATGLFTLPFIRREDMISRLILFAAVLFILTCLSFVSKGGIGFGDIKLLAAFSLVTDPENFFGVFLSSLLILFPAAISVAVKRKLQGESPGKAGIPYAPFFVLGLLANLLSG